MLAPRRPARPTTEQPPHEQPAAPSSPDTVAAGAVATAYRPLGPKITVQAGARRLTLSDLDKVLYPAAPVLLPHLAGRPGTFIRFPDGGRRAGTTNCMTQ